MDIRDLEHPSLPHPYRPASFYEQGGTREKRRQGSICHCLSTNPRTDCRSAARKRGLEFFPPPSGVRLGTAAERDGNMARLGRGVKGLGGDGVGEI